MELLLLRKIYSKKSTIGELSIDGIFFCYTLEDVCRDDNRNGIMDDNEEKIKGRTAIWAGKYKVILNMSTRFKRIMPLLLDVKNFGGIRIHNGNFPEDTEGCLLVGSSKETDFVGSSKETFGRLMVRLTNAFKQEEIFITIKNLPV